MKLSKFMLVLSKNRQQRKSFTRRPKPAEIADGVDAHRLSNWGSLLK